MAGGGGQGGVIGMLGRINQAENMGSPGFIAPSQLGQQAAYKPGFSGPSNITPMPTMSNDLLRSVAPQAPQMSPLAQQMMQRAQPPMSGLPAALMQMRGQLNQPMMRGPMPTYRSPALDYRPNMAPAMEALNRVKPSVYKTELDLARERIEQYEAADEARRMQEQNNGYLSQQG
jgi:hypothetical protein